MKKILLPVLGLLLGLSTSAHAIVFFDNTSTIYTRNEQDAVTTSDIWPVNPLRWGMDNPGRSIRGLYYSGPITTVYQAQNQTLGYVHNMLNWVLTLLGLIALAYLLYYGFMIITAAGDDAAVKKGRGGMRTSAIAILGIAVSRFIVSLIIYLIDTFILV